ncbi:GNAT family N-acetyltransferase [Paractinoplanes lichenicola]|uniref:GNAT family N-acetyltransferase n=1 Tax=Paractinoplanes lichenicola TaxID=2802976 RepID=A0ABS1VYX4_9ACTN|nr:GNAT family N-acetyltransferase [Actinoplanes lichenicola]MBL7259503.1 GNAT family N-acetyltransferase [Actinoplanes lichenicola]
MEVDVGIEVRDLAGLHEWSLASALYRAVFGYTHPEFGISPRLLAALRENSGSVIGAFDGPALVGFCYGFTAVDSGEIYHYSQAAAVAPRSQGLGIGRRLKFAQAEAARATGARTMRWTFDPYALRNAHFNLSVLGATAVKFLPDYYDDGSSDRLLVTWNLTAAHPLPRGSGLPDVTCRAVHARFAAPEAAERARLREALMARFQDGGVLVAVETHGDQAIYRFERAAK